MGLWDDSLTFDTKSTSSEDKKSPELLDTNDLKEDQLIPKSPTKIDPETKLRQRKKSKSPDATPSPPKEELNIDTTEIKDEGEHQELGTMLVLQLAEAGNELPKK